MGVPPPAVTIDTCPLPRCSNAFALACPVAVGHEQSAPDLKVMGGAAGPPAGDGRPLLSSRSLRRGRPRPLAGGPPVDAPGLVLRPAVFEQPTRRRRSRRLARRPLAAPNHGSCSRRGPGWRRHTTRPQAELPAVAERPPAAESESRPLPVHRSRQAAPLALLARDWPRPRSSRSAGGICRAPRSAANARTAMPAATITSSAPSAIK